MMDKRQFLSKLEKAILTLPRNERDDILYDYEEYFSNGLADGKTEEEISSSLGSPEQLGKELSAVYYVDAVQESGTTRNFFRAFWAVISLSFFNLLIVAGPLIALASLLFAGWVVAVSFSLTLVGVLINTLIYPEIFEAFNIFISIGLTGAGLLIGICMYAVTGWMKHWFVKYFQFNVRMVKGGMKYA